MSLFWYPAINGKYCFDGKYDKALMLDSYVRYYLARLQSMFKYEGLPDSIPAKWLEHYLLCNGNCIIANVEGKYYALTGGQGESANAYYIPCGYVVANPWIKTEGGTLSKTFWIEDINIGGIDHKQDACIVYNDTYSQGLLPMLQRYCSQLVENDITLSIADIMARAALNISTADDKTKASAEVYLQRLRAGDLAVLSEQAFIEGLQVREFSAAASSLTSLIEYHQYIKASLFNELGLNSNYNMKRESINSNESQLNDDMLHPLIDNMLKEREEGIKRVNDFFGLDIKVSFDSAWLENEKEEQAVLDQTIEEDTSDEDMKIYPSSDIEDNPGTIEDTEETIEETTEELSDEKLDEVVEEITQVIEVAAEEIIDNIEEKDGENNEV